MQGAKTKPPDQPAQYEKLPNPTRSAANPSALAHVHQSNIIRKQAFLPTSAYSACGLRAQAPQRCVCLGTRLAPLLVWLLWLNWAQESRPLLLHDGAGCCGCIRPQPGSYGWGPSLLHFSWHALVWL